MYLVLTKLKYSGIYNDFYQDFEANYAKRLKLSTEDQRKPCQSRLCLSEIQRFLILPQLTNRCIGRTLIKKWLKINQTRKRVCYLAIDRTRWQERNLFVASLIKNKRAIPLNWILKLIRRGWELKREFKDCKSGGYNLEKCQGKTQRLLSLILLIAFAYTCAVKNGQIITFKGVKEYICRLKENQRKDKRHSHFWVGLYGSL